MNFPVKDSRLAWLVLGTIFGICVAYFWPHEPAYAMATDRDTRFAICTVEVGPGSPDAVFVLDFLTARLTGGMLNVQAGAFTNFWFANVAEDFKINGRGDKAKYTIIPGSGFLNIGNQGGGGQTVATGLIYVAELSSGKVGCYRFVYRNQMAAAEPIRLEPVDYFMFRETQQK
jgi:hypothetical protein